jgi:hypothetical protein
MVVVAGVVPARRRIGVKHYHVVENTPGYLPESDEPMTFTSRRAAERYAAELAAELRELGYRTSGSARSGCISAERDSDDLGRVVEIIDCDDADCEVEL